MAHITLKRFELHAIIILAHVIGGVITYAALEYLDPNTDDLIEKYYATENAVMVSPHGLRGKMDVADDSFILVDLRSAEEYANEHITGAINIPAYSDKYTSAYHEKERILNAFESLPENKDIIVYCYSTPCMTGRKIGHMLAQEGIYVKHLGIGWNDWRYDWTAWNHEHEWNTTGPEAYLWIGNEPGKLNVTRAPPGCTLNGEFGC